MPAAATKPSAVPEGLAFAVRGLRRSERHDGSSAHGDPSSSPDAVIEVSSHWRTSDVEANQPRLPGSLNIGMASLLARRAFASASLEEKPSTRASCAAGMIGLSGRYAEISSTALLGDMAGSESARAGLALVQAGTSL